MSQPAGDARPGVGAALDENSCGSRFGLLADALEGLGVAAGTRPACCDVSVALAGVPNGSAAKLSSSWLEAAASCSADPNTGAPRNGWYVAEPGSAAEVPSPEATLSVISGACCLEGDERLAGDFVGQSS